MGTGVGPGTLCTQLPACPQRVPGQLCAVFRGGEPHPANQSVNGSQHHALEILPHAPVDVKLSPGMPAIAPGARGWSGLFRRSPGDGSSCSLQQPGGGWVLLSDGVFPWLLFIQEAVPPLQTFKPSMLVMASRQPLTQQLSVLGEMVAPVVLRGRW